MEWVKPGVQELARHQLDVKMKCKNKAKVVNLPDLLQEALTAVVKEKPGAEELVHLQKGVDATEVVAAKAAEMEEVCKIAVVWEKLGVLESVHLHQDVNAMVVQVKLRDQQEEVLQVDQQGEALLAVAVWVEETQLELQLV
jgi:hypothetical protein